MSEAALLTRDGDRGVSTLPECRLATPKDRVWFVTLWREYLRERRQMGSPMWDDDHNLRGFRQIFDSYTGGSRFGLCVLAWDGEEAVGTLLAGEPMEPLGWHTDHGRLAIMWGIYVSPPHRGHRVGLAMEQFGRPVMRRLGFDRVCTSVEHDNELGRANWQHWDESWGVQPTETLIVAELGD